MNVIPEAIGVYMRAGQQLRQDFVKLQKQNEIMREALEFIKSGCLIPPDGGSPDLMDAVKCAEEALNKIKEIEG